MQAIITKYLGATDHHGSRVKAKYQASSVPLAWCRDCHGYAFECGPSCIAARKAA